MSNFAKSCKSTVIPGLRYNDAAAAIEWLCSAFGFQKHAVYTGPDNTIAHAELSFGHGMIMLGSVDHSASPKFPMAQPAEINLRETQAPYLVIQDSAACDAIYASAKAAGATIVDELTDKGYGGKGFSCRDLEGHLWHFGTYDPWEVPPQS